MNVQDKTKKKYQITFQSHVGCLLNSEGGEMLETCFHKTYPPRYRECLQCLSQNPHRPCALDAFGRPVNVQRLVDGVWQSQDEKEFFQLPKHPEL